MTPAKPPPGEGRGDWAQSLGVILPLGARTSRWDHRVESWQAVAATPGFTEIRDTITRLAMPTPADRVLDLGAGTGLLSLGLAPLVHSVEAIDLSRPMLAHLAEQARTQGFTNVTTTQADLRCLPLPDGAFTLVVSNYAFHHLDHTGKALALSEVRRVLAPDGRLVIGDMMFALSLDRRDRQIIAGKVRAIARRGPAGIIRLGRNAARLAVGRWEHPESAASWVQLLTERRFVEINVVPLAHEGGIASARRPAAEH